MTKDSFVSLLDYFRSYEFILAKQELDIEYYPKGKKTNLGYFAETEDGDLIVVEIIAGRNGGKFGDVTFKTISGDHGSVVSSFTLSNAQVTKLVAAAAVEGIESKGVDYQGVVFVDALPAETAAKRFVVYANAGKYYTLNADEDALVEIEVVERPIMPVAAPSAQEGVLYNLTAEQEILYPKTTFKVGLYTYKKSDNTFVLQDIDGVEKVPALPAIDGAQMKHLYQLTKAEKPEQGDTRPKGSLWYVENGAWVQETKVLKTTTKLPYGEVAAANTNYLVDGVVTKFASGKFTKVAKVEAVETLPDVSSITVDDSVIYVLTQNDGERVAGTKWVFVEDEFVEFLDPGSPVTGGGEGAQGMDQNPPAP